MNWDWDDRAPAVPHILSDDAFSPALQHMQRRLQFKQHESRSPHRQKHWRRQRKGQRQQVVFTKRYDDPVPMMEQDIPEHRLPYYDRPRVKAFHHELISMDLAELTELCARQTFPFLQSLPPSRRPESGSHIRPTTEQFMAMLAISALLQSKHLLDRQWLHESFPMEALLRWMKGVAVLPIFIQIVHDMVTGKNTLMAPFVAAGGVRYLLSVLSPKHARMSLLRYGVPSLIHLLPQYREIIFEQSFILTMNRLIQELRSDQAVIDSLAQLLASAFDDGQFLPPVLGPTLPMAGVLCTWLCSTSRVDITRRLWKCLHAFVLHPDSASYKQLLVVTPALQNLLDHVFRSDRDVDSMRIILDLIQHLAVYNPEWGWKVVRRTPILTSLLTDLQQSGHPTDSEMTIQALDALVCINSETLDMFLEQGGLSICLMFCSHPQETVAMAACMLCHNMAIRAAVHQMRWFKQLMVLKSWKQAFIRMIHVHEAAESLLDALLRIIQSGSISDDDYRPTQTNMVIIHLKQLQLPDLAQQMLQQPQPHLQRMGTLLYRAISV